MTRSRLILLLALIVVIVAVAPSSRAATNEAKEIVFVHGKASHGYGGHAYGPAFRMLPSFRGFALAGIIFNQGYNNALGNTRPNLYAKTFQAMIGDWQPAFDDDALPFGIVELTAGAPPQTLDNFELMMVDAAPFIREAQFRAYRELENIGWPVLTTSRCRGIIRTRSCNWASDSPAGP